MNSRMPPGDALKKIQYYYVRTDDSPICSVATSKCCGSSNLLSTTLIHCRSAVLDPRLKMDYYKAQEWPEQWQKFCEKAALNVIKQYTTNDDADDQSSFHNSDSQVASDAETYDLFMQHVYGNHNRPKRNKVSSEYEEYISKGREFCPDPLLWWRYHQGVYPVLSRVARDYLAIPGKKYVASNFISVF